MNFLFPVGFVGLLSLPVIVVLHLLRERQRRYLVSNLDLWSFLQSEVRGPRVRRLPITWLLFFDLMIAALLSLAWTQPQASLTLPQTAARHRVILLDVSASMLADDGGMSRFERARLDAAKMIADSSRRDLHTLIAFGTHARVVADSRQGGIQALLDELGRLQAGETGSALREALALGQAAMDRSLPAEIAVFTDGALPESSAFTSGEVVLPLDWRLIGRPQDNQAVIEVEAVSLGKDNRVQIFARFGNFAGRPVAREIVLELDGREYSREKVSIAPESSVARVWEVQPDQRVKAAAIILRGNDALFQDDVAYIGLQTVRETSVAIVADEPGVIEQAVRAIPEAQLEIIKPEEYSAVMAEIGGGDAYDLTIYRDFLPQTWPMGSVLIVDPPQAGSGKNSSLVEEGPALVFGDRKEVPPAASVRVSTPHPLVDGIDFSGVRWSRAWELVSPPASLHPLLMADDSPLVYEGNLESSGGFHSTVILLADLSAGNFVKHPAFPIFIAGIIDAAGAAPLPASIQTGEAIWLPKPGRVSEIRVTQPGGETVSLDNSWPLEWAQTSTSGLYIFELGSVGEKIEIASGVNAGSVLESDLRTANWVRQVQENPVQEMSVAIDEPESVNLWPWLLAAALILLLVEARLAWGR